MIEVWDLRSKRRFGLYMKKTNRVATLVGRRLCAISTLGIAIAFIMYISTPGIMCVIAVILLQSVAGVATRKFLRQLGKIDGCVFPPTTLLTAAVREYATHPTAACACAIVHLTYQRASTTTIHSTDKMSFALFN